MVNREMSFTGLFCIMDFASLLYAKAQAEANTYSKPI
jgi:hypothetical protein